MVWWSYNRRRWCSEEDAALWMDARHGPVDTGGKEISLISEVLGDYRLNLKASEKIVHLSIWESRG